MQLLLQPQQHMHLLKVQHHLVQMTAEQLIVSVNGVTQAPNDAYSVSGSNIIFTETLSSSDTIDYILALGEVGNSVVPTDGSVTGAKFSSTVYYRDGIRINGSQATL